MPIVQNKVNDNYDFSKNLIRATDEDIRTILVNELGASLSDISLFMAGQPSKGYLDVFTKKYGNIRLMNQRVIYEHADLFDAKITEREMHFKQIPDSKFPSIPVKICYCDQFKYALVKIKKTYKARPVTKETLSKSRDQKIYRQMIYGIMIGHTFFPADGSKTVSIKAVYDSDEYPSYEIMASYSNPNQMENRWADQVSFLLDELIEDAKDLSA